MNNITVIIPSLRPHLLQKRIEEFKNTQGDFDYTLAVISPFKVQGSKIVWLEEKEPRGSVYATNRGIREVESQYYVYWADDVSPTENCLSTMVDFMKNNPDPFLGAFKMEHDNGDEIGPFGSYDKLYACYGCISKWTISLVGGFLFDEVFKYSWCDIDLSLRVWELDKGLVKICKEAKVLPKQENDIIYRMHRTTFNLDFQQFTHKWHQKLGKTTPLLEGAINRRLN